MAEFKPIPVEKSSSTFTPIPVESSEYDPEANEGFFKEVGEGFLSGVTKIPQGILELGATGIDLVAGTETADAVTETFEDFREARGIDPTGFAGKATEVITQFGIPGGAAFKAVGALSKAGKLPKSLQGTSKIKELSVAAGASGAADLVFATNDTGSLIEGYFDGATGPESEEGLSNRGQALENLKDRLFIGAEGAIAVPVAAAGIKAGTKAVQSNLVKGTAKAASESAVGKPVLEGIRGVTQKGAQKVLGGIERGAKYVEDLDQRVMNLKPGETASKSEEFLSSVLSGLRPRGRSPEEVYMSKYMNQADVQAKMRSAQAYTDRLNKSIEDVVDGIPKHLQETKRLSFESLIDDYLRASPKDLDEIFQQLPAGISRESMDNMRRSINKETKGIINSNFFKTSNATSDEVKDVILKAITGEGGYLRRDYEIFRNKSYEPTALAKEGAKQFFKTNRDQAEKELQRAFAKDIGGDLFSSQKLKDMNARIFSDGDTRTMVVLYKGPGSKITDAAAEAATEAFLNKYRRQSARNIQGGRVAEMKLDTDMFLGKKNIPAPLKALMGEIKNPTQAYQQTMLDLATFKAADNFYGNIASLAKNNSGIGKLFRNSAELTEDQIAGLKDRGYVLLGSDDARSTLRGASVNAVDELKPGAVPSKTDSSNTGLTAKDIDETGWGSLNGYMVPKQLYNDMTQHAYGNSTATDMLGSLLNFGMKAKGVSQYGKTVLSPVTQVRNFTSASLFAAMNGNVGRGANIRDSMLDVYKAAMGKGDEAFLREIEEVERLGLLGNSSQLREVKEMLAGSRSGFKGFDKGPSFFDKGVRIKGRKISPKRFTQVMEKFYQGSDDAWKLYSYLFEKNKLKSALQKMSPEDQYRWMTNSKPGSPTKALNPKELDQLVKERAAQIARDTVPNYAKAPKAIKAFRKLPIGNFVTFPYEIYRTGFNTVDQAMKEIASGVPAIQNIGYRRLAGVTTVNYALPTALVSGATALTGVGQDQIDAFKRSFGAPWVKNATLIPGGRDKEGNLQFYNFSTFNPYDQITRYANTSINSYQEAKRTGKSTSSAIASGAFNAAAEGLQAFADPAILAGAMMDVTARDGRTTTGAQIYKSGDPNGTKLAKSIAHVMGTLIPTISPVEIRGGVPRPRRFVRAVLGGESGTDFISSEDKLGRENSMDSELLTAMFGFRPLKFDPKNALKFKGFEVSRAQTDAKSLFTSLTDDANVSSNQLIQGYIDANTALKKADEDFYQLFEDANTLGLSDKEVKKILKSENITVPSKVVKGIANPYVVSSQQKDKMRRAGTYDRFPKNEIRDLYRSFKNTPLTTDPRPTPMRAPTPNVNAPSSNFVPIPISNATPFNPMPASNVTPVASSINRTNLSPSLLGDPRNADILNRSS